METRSVPRWTSRFSTFISNGVFTNKGPYLTLLKLNYVGNFMAQLKELLTCLLRCWQIKEVKSTSCAMGHAVSPMVANLYMEKVEKENPKLFFREHHQSNCWTTHKQVNPSLCKSISFDTNCLQLLNRIKVHLVFFFYFKFTVSWMTENQKHI